METARDRISDGVLLLRTDPHARQAFEIMNRAIETAARRRATPVPSALPKDCKNTESADLS
jgi:hypothetical protein